MWPTVIVLDTERLMKAFRQHAAQSGKPLDFPDEMVAEIVSCLRHARRATHRLDSLLFSLVISDFDHRYAMYVDGAVITFVQDLGELLIEQIHHHNLYDDHGVLPYRYREPRSHDFNCVVLKRRTYELHPNHARCPTTNRPYF
jgi:hypothetical protein